MWILTSSVTDMLVVTAVIGGVVGLLFAGLVSKRSSTETTTAAASVTCVPNTKKDVKKMTTQDWQKLLTPEQYYVTREGGTEPPFSGAYYNHHEEGIYQCVCCGTDLFSSKTKFESGSGWPSFHSPEGKGDEKVETHTDTSHMMVRTEVLCKECKAHLGHLFNDGPEPSGLRYCINSLSLKFTPKKIT